MTRDVQKTSFGKNGAIRLLRHHQETGNASTLTVGHRCTRRYLRRRRAAAPGPHADQRAVVQSVFVKDSDRQVLREGAIAAGHERV